MHTIEPTAGTTHTITTDNAEPQRLDLLLQEITGLSRSAVQKLIKEGHVGNVKSSTLVKPGTTLTIHFPIPEPLTSTLATTQELPVKVIFEHESFLIIDKPAGLSSHRPHRNHTAVSLVDWLVTYFKEIKEVGSPDRPGIVHRLDKETSGLMIVARNAHAHEKLSALFKDRQIQKSYLALVEGHPPREGSVELNIIRHPTIRVKMTHHKSQGRTAITHYKVVEYYKHMALVELKPLTGRTHQIRVHMAAIGHPLVGDILYGKKSPLIGRQALHASELAFEFEGTAYQFTSPLPADILSVYSKNQE